VNVNTLRLSDIMRHVTKHLATHPQKRMHVWMADMIVQKIETKNQFCLCGANLNINFFVFFFTSGKIQN